MSSLQSSYLEGLRSSTPKVPPGFENIHAHPATLLNESLSGRSTPTRTVSVTTPALPAVLLSTTQQASMPRSKLTQPHSDTRLGEDESEQEIQLSENVTEAEPSRLASETDLQSQQHSVPPVKLDEQAREANDLQVTDAASEAELGEPHLKAVTKKLGKIEIPLNVTAAVAATDTIVPVPAKNVTPAMESSVVTTPDAVPSQPATPTTATSEASRSFAPRPRTIRLTTSMIQKAEAANPASPATEKSAILPSVSQTRSERSRQPSLSSVSRSRPSTPAMSEMIMSQDVSRAGSPPPGGIVGSAPARTKSKNQTKKDRKEKAKKAVSTEPTVTPAAPTTEPVGPIIARQKKQKKKNASVTDASIKPKETQKSAELSKPETKERLAERSPSPEKKLARDTDGPVKEMLEEATTVPQINEAEEPPKHSYTVKDLCSDASRMPDDSAAIQKLLTANVTSVNKLLGEMLASGDLSRDHPWLSAPPFNSATYKLPPDSRKGQDYLNGNGYSAGDAFGYVYLPQKEKRALHDGHAVSVADLGERKNDLLRRCLISPNGWVMRHLSAEESERVLELEERRNLYLEEFGELGTMNGLGVLEDDDFINLGGGIEELGRFGDRHGVCWVVSDDQQEDDEAGVGVYDDLDDEDLLGAQDALSDETDEDLVLDLSGNGNTSTVAASGRGGNASGTTAITMPGAWDPAFNASASNDVGPSELPPISSGVAAMSASANKTVNLRAMDTNALHARIKEKQKEMETLRKEADKADKSLTRKNKEFARWRDGVLLKA